MTPSIMDATALHLEIRNALSLADELSRHEHALGNDTLAAQLSVARTTLSSLERDAGRSHARMAIANPAVVEKLDRSLRVIRDRSEEIPLVLRPRITMFMEAVERIVFAEQRPAAPVPAKPLFGALPLARVIPQDLHSVGDYLVGGALLTSALVARTTRGRIIGLAAGLLHLAVAASSDVKLSLGKVVPVELHELLDHAGGVKAALVPSILGYVRKDPVAATIQMLAGVGSIALSLFTDYRADKGIGRARRSQGGPQPKRDRLPKLVQNRVPEVQRPLEGLSGDICIPSVEL